MKQHLLCSIIILALIQITGCRKDPLKDMTFDESRIYVTNNDPNVVYSTFSTFSISDSAGVLENGFFYKESTDVDLAYVNAVRSQMNARGFTEVAKDAQPDLAINLTRFYSTNTGIIDIGYWGSYGGFYDPFYWGLGGLGYGGVPFFTTYSFTESAITLDILDLKNASETGEINIIWNGLIRGGGIFSTSTASGSVDALFNQSPYIQK
jgi:hypothetical protein